MMADPQRSFPMRCLMALVLGVLFVLPISVSAAAADRRRADQKAVLVTGASTGIGRRITERLAAKGYFVYAGARQEADLAALNALPNVQAVRLDVTQATDIAAALDTVKKGGRGLDGLVNNAGIGTLDTIVGGSDEEFDRAMAVNVYGPYRVTKAFAPLIIASQGRITTIGSISGVLASGISAAYAMSKHAMEAFTDSLAQEMAPHGVRVSIVEPGTYDSEISRNALARSKRDRHDGPDRSMYPQPDDVALAVEDALFGARPKRRYLVVPVEVEAQVVIQKQLAQLVELNEGHRYTYDRNALVKMLDETLQGSRPRTK
jgi:NAD(P)-dependent dehydrogenase (short-subunit alcohol dehydrogenase family)